MDASLVSPCTNCGGNNLYLGPVTSAGGGYAPNYLSGLGSFLRTAKFQLVVCGDCGLTRFFAEPPAREHLSTSPKWRKLRS